MDTWQRTPRQGLTDQNAVKHQSRREPLERALRPRGQEFPLLQLRQLPEEVLILACGRKGLHPPKRLMYRSPRPLVKGAVRDPVVEERVCASLILDPDPQHVFPFLGHTGGWSYAE